jgi:hypothetical protein
MGTGKGFAYFLQGGSEEQSGSRNLLGDVWVGRDYSEVSHRDSFFASFGMYHIGGKDRERRYLEG